MGITMEFVELKSHRELEHSFEILKELAPQLNKTDFFKSLNHELLKNHKLFGLKSSGKLVSVAAVWILMNGLLEKLMWIYAFATTKSMRSKGFGKNLLLELENYAKRENFHEIRVHANRESALKFWENRADFEVFSQVLRKMVK